MFDLPQELQEKFLRFHADYELALVWLADAPGTDSDKQASAAESAKRSTNTSDIEVDIFLRLIRSEIPKPN
jgi:hypothetical protein